MKWFWGASLMGLALVGGLYYEGLSWQLRHWISSPIVLQDDRPLALTECAGCNLILISLDTLRADALDLDDPNGVTPNLARIARQSLRFSNAYSTAFYTTPSHMSAFTSLFPNRHKVTGREITVVGFNRTSPQSPVLDQKYKTMAELLRESGYSTHWFGPRKLKHLGLDLGFKRGFDNLSPTLFTRPGRNGQRPETFDSDRFSQILTKEKQPFFYFLHSYVTHLPYFSTDENLPFRSLFHPNELIRKFLRAESWQGPPPKMADPDVAEHFLHNLGQFQLWTLEKDISENKDPVLRRLQVQAVHQAYNRSVKILDQQIGQMWDTLVHSGQHKNTIVVIFSDHGEEIFEHDHASHSSFYEHTIRIPLMIYHPRLTGPLNSRHLASLVDILPTTFAILGLNVPEQAQGIDLTQSTRTHVFGFSLGSLYTSDGEWKLLRGRSGVDEFYNLRTDPEEKHNLVHSKWPPIRKALTRLIEERNQWELEQTL